MTPTSLHSQGPVPFFFPKKKKKLQNSHLLGDKHRFLRTEVFSPEKLPGNISVATAVGFFVGGVIAVRTWGDLLVPE